MFKRDAIFWWASGIFLLALALFAITQEQLWLSLMIGSYLLRPTLASLGVAKRYVDERQMSINYRSSNIGFAVMMIVCVIFAIKLSAENNHDFEMFNMAIIIGLAAKALFNVILAKNLREGASKIIIGVGLMVALFSALDAGSFVSILVAISPGLTIAGIGLLSKKYPRIVGMLALVTACLLILLIMTIGLRNSKSLWTQILVAIIIGAPLITAGVCLLRGDKKAVEAEPERTI
jgi:hypothetical protein